jgi:hypothetical protein
LPPASPLFELARVLVRLDHVAGKHHRVEALLKDAKTLEELNAALRELCLEGTFDVE